MKALLSDESDDDGSINCYKECSHKKARVLHSSSDDESGESKAVANPISFSQSSKINIETSDEHGGNSDNQDRFEKNLANERIEERKKIKPSFLKSGLITESDIESDGEIVHNPNVFKKEETSENNQRSLTNENKTSVGDFENYESKNFDSNANYSDDDVEENLLKVPPQSGCTEKKQHKQSKKKKKVDHKLAIRSETQRMEREIASKLPYHRPKQRGLQEFLSRKKQIIPIDCLRINSSKMVNTWTELHENMKESLYFFKSESEEEDEIQPKLNVNIEETGAKTEDEKGQTNEIDKEDIRFTKDFECVKEAITTNISYCKMNEFGKESENIATKNVTTESHNNCMNIESSTLAAGEFQSSKIHNSVDKPGVPDMLELGNENLTISSEGKMLLLSPKVAVPKLTLVNCHNSETEIVEAFKTTSKCNSQNETKSSLSPVRETSGNELNIEKTPSGVEKTTKWLDDIVSYEEVESIKKKLQFSPSTLLKIPTLSKSSDEFIDLDSPKKANLHPGAIKLMDRFLKNQPVKSIKNIEVSTTATERDDKGEITKVAIETIVLTSDSHDNIFEKNLPGGKLQRLRATLKDKIEGEWKEEFKKRCAEFGAPIKDGFEETVESGDDELEEEIDDESTSESEPEENDVALIEKPRDSCAFGDSEAEESDGEGEDGDDEQDDNDDVQDGNDDDDDNDLHGEDEGDIISEEAQGVIQIPDDEYDDCTLPPYQPGGIMVQGDGTPTQRNQQASVFSPALSLTGLTPRTNRTPNTDTRHNICETPVAVPDLKTPLSVRKLVSPLEATSVMKTLFGMDSPGLKSQLEHDIDDPFLFVSGAFPEASPAKQSQPSFSQLKPREFSEDSCEPNLTEETTKAQTLEEETLAMPAAVNLLSPAKSDVPILKRKGIKLKFSDDEDSGDEGQETFSNVDGSEDEGINSESNAAGASEAQNVTDNEGFSDDEGGPLEYDSEENEIQPVKPSEFFENEAELSESEWSGDEDEQGLDKMDAEAGDADQLDEEQVASQLGRIHMRRLLDQDARDVRMLQELLFEDGDLHSDGKGRDRKFRWKNLTGFDRDEIRGPDGSDSEGEVDQEELKLAKLRHEKTQMILQLEKDGKETALDENLEKTSLLHLGRQLLSKIQSQTVLKPVKSKITRPSGSFLSKDASFLSNVAKAAGQGKNALLGPSHSRNFVFAAQSPDKTATPPDEAVVKSMKRKSLSLTATAKRAKLSLKLSKTPTLLEQLN